MTFDTSYLPLKISILINWVYALIELYYNGQHLLCSMWVQTLGRRVRYTKWRISLSVPQLPFIVMTQTGGSNKLFEAKESHNNPQKHNTGWSLENQNTRQHAGHSSSNKQWAPISFQTAHSLRAVKDEYIRAVSKQLLKFFLSAMRKRKQMCQNIFWGTLVSTAQHS